MAKRIPMWIPNTIGVIGISGMLLGLGYLTYTAPKWTCDREVTYTLTFHSDKNPKYNSTETKTVCAHYSEH